MVQVCEDIKVLVIDDSEDIIFLIKNILEMECFQVITALSAKEAWKFIDKTIDVIVLDLMMPEISGREFLKEFREHKEYRDVHVIVLTAEENNDEEIGFLFDEGANDYIKKPFFPVEFISRVRNHGKIMHLTRSLKKRNIAFKRKNIALNEIIKREEFLNKRILDRTFKLRRAYRKIAKLNERLKIISTHDKLTALYNRGAIITFLENDIERVRRIDKPLSLMMIDLDFFKKVNDNYGHLAGDEVLRIISKILKTNVRAIDLIGRYGGEEFIVILPDTEKNEVITLCERLLEKTRDANIVTDKGTLTQTISIGVTQYKKDETIDQFIERADIALYQAKASGRNRFIMI